MRVLAGRVEAHLRGDNPLPYHEINEVMATFPATARELMLLRAAVQAAGLSTEV